MHCGVEVFLCAECGGLLAELGCTCQACGRRDEGGQLAGISSAIEGNVMVEEWPINKSVVPVVDAVEYSFAKSDLDGVSTPSKEPLRL